MGITGKGIKTEITGVRRFLIAEKTLILARTMNNEIQNLLTEQLLHWDLAKSNYEALNCVKTKTLDVNGCAYKVQFNPARIVSSGASVDAKSIQQRKCFLCEENRPQEQKGIDFQNKYQILINPFPIFPKHFTIPDTTHTPQLISHRMGDMLDLAEYMSDYVIFYNGPKSGASAPDHAHFQAGNKGFLPVETAWQNHIEKTIFENKNTKLHLVNYGFPFLLFETDDKQEGVNLFEKIYHTLKIKEGETEPMMNILVWFENSPKEGFRVAVFPRKKHRPDCYFAQDDSSMMISPGLVDVAGVLITARETDFDKITSKDIEQILKEVCLSREELKEIVEKL